MVRVVAGRVEDGDADYAVGVDYSQDTVSVSSMRLLLSG